MDFLSVLAPRRYDTSWNIFWGLTSLNFCCLNRLMVACVCLYSRAFTISDSIFST